MSLIHRRSFVVMEGANDNDGDVNWGKKRGRKKERKGNKELRLKWGRHVTMIKYDDSIR